jgi:hypothetical protein
VAPRIAERPDGSRRQQGELEHAPNRGDRRPSAASRPRQKPIERVWVRVDELIGVGLFLLLTASSIVVGARVPRMMVAANAIFILGSAGLAAYAARLLNVSMQLERLLGMIERLVKSLRGR